MLIESKTKTCKCCIRNVMTYGIETRVDTMKTKGLLRTTEMKIFHIITGKMLRDRIRNTSIREQYLGCHAKEQTAEK